MLISTEAKKYMRAKKEINHIVQFLERKLSKGGECNAVVNFEIVEAILTLVLSYLHMQKHSSKDFSEGMLAVLNGCRTATEIGYYEKLAREIVDGFILANPRMELLSMEFSQVLGLLHQQLLEGNDLRKKDGVYYTPPKVVQFMIDMTLTKNLKKFNEEVNKSLVKNDKASLATTLISIQKYLVIDPACGSGAFLTSVYDCFIQFYNNLMKTLASKDMGGFFKCKNLAEYIFSNHIRGADIDVDAVRLTRLTLFYKALDYCDGDYQSVIKILERIIQCEDSLTGRLQEEGKFQLVIGNPPYIANKSLPRETKETIKSKFKTATGQYDSVVPFIELGIRMLDRGGQLCFITSNKFMAADYGYKIRKMLLQDYELTELVDLSSEKIFPDASAYPVIIVVDKKRPTIESHTKIFREGERISVPQNTFLSLGQSVITTEISEPMLGPIKKIQGHLGRISSKNIRCGLAVAGFNKKISVKPGRGLSRLVQAGDIQAYDIAERDQYIPLSLFNEKQLRLLKNKKLVIPGIARELKASIDECGKVLGRVYFIVDIAEHSQGHDGFLYYLQGLFNSAVLNFYYKVLYWPVHMAGGYLRFNSTYLATLPIAGLGEGQSINGPIQQRIFALSKQLSWEKPSLELKEELLLELEVMVFMIYGLSNKEAEIVLKHLNYPSKMAKKILSRLKWRI